MNTKKLLASKLSNPGKLVGVSSIFRDENNQLKMIFDKDDGTQTIKGSSKFDHLETLKFKPGTIKSPSLDLQASIYASVHNYRDYLKSGLSEEPDRDSVISDTLFATSENFAGFASKHFQLKDANPECHRSYPITVSLLPPKEKAIHLAAIASWLTLLKVMGDFPESENEPEKSDIRPIPLIYIKRQLSIKYTKKDVDDAVKKYEELARNPQAKCDDLPFMYPGHNILDHIQFICSLGMLKNSLRDEIYCQVLKQMTQNPSQNSISRGWLVLSLMVGAFHPTETLMPCLLTFLRDSQCDIAPKIEFSLRRALRNGTRSYPPGWTEFQAMKNYKPIFLPVTLMTRERLLMRVDASTTVKELCVAIARSLCLKETTGFSLFATLKDKISYLGDSSHRIMDTICECEFFSKASSGSESNSPWCLYFRKEYFSPWQTDIKDPVAADLITSQVMRGITVEEYNLEESQLIYFAALKYYINDQEIRMNKLTKLLESFLPKYCLQKKPIDSWVNLVTEKLKRDFQSKPEKTASSCKGEVINFAIKYLYKSFCKLYEIKQFISPNNKLSRVTGAIHQNGLSIVDESEEQKMYLAYEEMIHLKRKGAWLYIRDIKGITHSIESNQVEHLFILLSSFLERISNDSYLAVAICRCNVPEKMNFTSSLLILNGDLIVLEQPFKFFEDSEYIDGLCLRTQRQGQFSKDIIHPLATTGTPDNAHLNKLASYLKSTEWSQESVGRYYNYSLEEYGKDHLQTSELTMTKLLSRTSIKRNGFNEAWKHTKDPIKYPLCKKIQQRADLKYCACKIFQAILMYMEDVRRIEAISDIALASEKIFEIAVRNKHLHNELYVQLIKQLTENEDVTSKNKGWVLMWLLTGCIVPEEEMYQEVLKFLQVNESSLAEHCFNRIKILKLSGNRVYPPNTLEHLSVSAHSVDPLNLEVFLPDSSVLKLEVFSHSKIMEMCDKIVSKLGLQFGFGYSLFLKTKDRVIPLADYDYIMDILAHVEIYFLSQPLQGKDKTFKFQFMKKLWTLDDLREDLVADIIFNYNQDLPNYIAGFHDCSIATATKLTALIFKATHENTPLNNDNFKDVIIPEKFIKAMTKEKWMKEVFCELENMTLSKDEAKLAYVNITKGFRTYGSVFFEIQMSEKSNTLQLSVNRNGILIMDPVTKEIINSFNFQHLRNWIHDNGKVTLIADKECTIGPNRVFFYIDKFQGELLDDLIVSNVEFSLNSKLKSFQVFSGAKIGETPC